MQVQEIVLKYGNKNRRNISAPGFEPTDRMGEWIRLILRLQSTNTHLFTYQMRVASSSHFLVVVVAAAAATVDVIIIRRFVSTAPSTSSTANDTNTTHID